MNVINSIEQLAGEIAGLVPELARDATLNREEFIANKIRQALRVPQLVSKPLILERALVGFDIESTGTDVALDRIISIAVRRIDPPDLFDASERVTLKQWLVNPGRPIPAASTRIHGITDEMVKDCPLFADVAQEIHTWFSGADVTGYNIVNFDVPILWEHFIREDIEWAVPKIVDASGIFQRKVPRNLTAALKRYCGRDHAGAHEAMADVFAAMDVLEGQRAKYADLATLNVAGLAEFSTSEEYEGQPAKRLDLSGLIIEDAAGVARFTHKKVRGVAVEDDMGYAGWLLNQSWLPEHTRRVLVRVLEKIEREENPPQ